MISNPRKPTRQPSLDTVLQILSAYPNIKPQGLRLLLGLNDSQESLNIVHKYLRLAKNTLKQSSAQRIDLHASRVAHAQAKIPCVLIAIPPDSDPASPFRTKPSPEGLRSITESAFCSPSVSVGTPGDLDRPPADDGTPLFRALHPEGYLRDLYLEAKSSGTLVEDYSRRVSTSGTPS